MQLFRRHTGCEFRVCRKLGFHNADITYAVRIGHRLEVLSTITTPFKQHSFLSIGCTVMNSRSITQFPSQLTHKIDNLWAILDPEILGIIPSQARISGLQNSRILELTVL